MAKCRLPIPEFFILDLHTEAAVGNPASDKRKLTEKRRKKYEQRLGPGVYLPKEERLKLNAELEKMAAAEANKPKKADKPKAEKPKAEAPKSDKPQK